MSTAVIVEPRRHPALSFVLQNFTAHLPKDWKILIFHGKDNKEFVHKIVEGMEDPSRFLEPIQLDIDNLTLFQYNKVLMSQAFYQCIPTETILIFQTDTMILEPLQLQEFLSYDYVGAPWKTGHVGNGGLSLRKKSKMITIITTVNQFHMNEDVYFSMQKVVPLKKPTFQDAQRFSVETVFYPSPFGIHAPWKNLSFEEMDRLTAKYPAIQELIRLQYHSA
jgi:hypothetical protein